ncbi:5-oxoprolinase subunit PxpA [Mesonia sp. K4-1]|uniref:5-oxoprolinase subunit PxpA n=1 Tax=Mesonia sp. K4-1 TaxID=2602760 RepID=UPI0011CA8FE7|nr:5-oxoprolinase subunit PxpA [Mesonia sp. K4-1]TXK74927.1 5-oxoprolinase subunit PxpA [Mesonia sp. K4-1]
MIKFNCDLAEGGKYDERLMPLISYCNVACGGHFGNKQTVLEAVQLAIKNNVNIGAHPSYPDVENFGRKKMDMSLKDLRKSLKTQILLIKDTVERLGEKLHHIKPHGALYNELKYDKEKSLMMIDLVKEIDDVLVLFVPPKSVIEEEAKNKIKTLIEGFADRAYEEDLSLVSRGKTGAVLHDKNQILEKVKLMGLESKIITLNGVILNQKIDTICIHSDTENSVEILEYLYSSLHKKQ